MAIDPLDIQKIKDATDLIELIGKTVALKKAGIRWVGLCPFHAERTPSFTVTPRDGFWHCFGCRKSGDAITWLIEVEHMAFPDAVQELADRAGIAVTRTSRPKKYESLIEAVKLASEWYSARLMSADDAGTARGYVRSRGMGREAIERFGLGWSPADGTALWDALGSDIGESDFIAAGIGYRAHSGQMRDRFAGRLMFPIHDQSGNPVAFAARILDESPSEPKYTNTKTTPIYRKSEILYNLHNAKQSTVRLDKIVIVEGYTDVISLDQHGHPNVVATCGTAVTDHHINSLTRYTRNIVLAMDGDSAGTKAAADTINRIDTASINLAIADLAGCDPADIAMANPDRLVHLLTDAANSIDWSLERIAALTDFASPQQRVANSTKAAEIIAAQPHPEIRRQYAQQIAERYQVSLDHITNTINHTRKRKTRP